MEINRKESVLYHYTDYIAFNGIMRDRELRVNNVRNMNDAAEMHLFISGIFRAVENKLEKEKARNKLEKFKKLEEELSKKYFDYAAYAACFSTYRDDASQWERYGNRGKGVCLGMDRSVLEKMTGGAITLQKVYYQDDVESHPLVKKLHWREIIGIRMLWGELSDKNNPYLAENQGSNRLMYFPDGVNIMEPNRPYAELVLGIHNIFKFFHVEYVRRLSYNELPTSPKWGLRYSLSLTF